MVSIVIPAYNRVKTIARAVESGLAQSLRDIEVIVVDDGSTDTTSEVVGVLNATDARVRCIRQSGNCGAQAARNTGIRAARGEWITFLDSDDMYLSHSVEVRLTEAVVQGVKVIHSDGEVIRVGDERGVFGVPALRGQIYCDLLRRPGPMFPALMVHRDALVRIGLLDERIIAWQEWDTAIRLAKYYAFGFVDEPTFVYDCRGHDTMSKNPRLVGGYEQIVRKHAWAILTHAGFGMLGAHYRDAAAVYEQSGRAADARRCLRYARTIDRLGTFQWRVRHEISKWCSLRRSKE